MPDHAASTNSQNAKPGSDGGPVIVNSSIRTSTSQGQPNDRDTSERTQAGTDSQSVSSMTDSQFTGRSNVSGGASDVENLNQAMEDLSIPQRTHPGQESQGNLAVRETDSQGVIPSSGHQWEAPYPEDMQQNASLMSYQQHADYTEYPFNHPMTTWSSEKFPRDGIANNSHNSLRHGWQAGYQQQPVRTSASSPFAA